MKSRICEVTSCSTPYFARGFCEKHYIRLRVSGNPFSIISRDPREGEKYRDHYKIPLGLGAKQGFTQVDLEDSYLDIYKWRMGNRGYVVARVKGREVLIHRLINKTSKGFSTDHINRNKLDNRRANLRTCTISENALNASVRPSKTGLRNVFKIYNKYRALYELDGKQVYLGYFRTADEAHRAVVADKSKKKILVYGEGAI